MPWVVRQALCHEEIIESKQRSELLGREREGCVWDRSPSPLMPFVSCLDSYKQ